MFPKYSDWNITYTAKGQRKQWLAQLTKYAMFFAAIAGVYWMRKSGNSLASVLRLVMLNGRGLVLTALGLLSQGLKRIQEAI